MTDDLLTHSFAASVPPPVSAGERTHTQERVAVAKALLELTGLTPVILPPDAKGHDCYEFTAAHLPQDENHITGEPPTTLSTRLTRYLHDVRDVGEPYIANKGLAGKMHTSLNHAEAEHHAVHVYFTEPDSDVPLTPQQVLEVVKGMTEGLTAHAVRELSEDRKRDLHGMEEDQAALEAAGHFTAYRAGLLYKNGIMDGGRRGWGKRPEGEGDAGS